MSKKVVVLIDLANISYGFDIIKKNRRMSPGTKIDYNKLISHITSGSEVIDKSIYLGTNKSGNEKGQQGFLTYFRKNGFNVITKECKIIKQDDGSTKIKANFDVEIATDCCTHIWQRECKEIILISGDSDFAYLLQKARDFDFQISVVSTQATISTELREGVKETGRLILLDDVDLNYLTFVNERKIAA